MKKTIITNIIVISYSTKYIAADIYLVLAANIYIPIYYRYIILSYRFKYKYTTYLIYYI